MASQATMEAAARESRANAREDMAILTSGARQKVDSALARLQTVAQQAMHPFDKQARDAAYSRGEDKKRQDAEKRDEISSIAQQQAQQERLAARSQVAQQVLAGAGGARYVQAVPGGEHPPPSLLEDSSDLPASVDQVRQKEDGGVSEAASDSQQTDKPHLERTREFKGLKGIPKEATTPKGANAREATRDTDSSREISAGGRSPTQISSKSTGLDLNTPARSADQADEREADDGLGRGGAIAKMICEREK